MATTVLYINRKSTKTKQLGGKDFRCITIMYFNWYFWRALHWQTHRLPHRGNVTKVSRVSQCFIFMIIIYFSITIPNSYISQFTVQLNIKHVLYMKPQFNNETLVLELDYAQALQRNAHTKTGGQRGRKAKHKRSNDKIIFSIHF